MNELKLERMGVVETVRFVNYNFGMGKNQHSGVEVVIENRDGGKMNGYINHEDLPQLIEYLQKNSGK